MRAWSFRVEGRVQGVGYRWATQAQARRLTLTGWVQNEADGGVSGWAQGPDDRLEAFALWLAEGPPGAAVTAVVRTEASPRPELASFLIRS